jgi:excisionase family DNA binding protein
MDDLMTVDEIAEFLRVSRPTVYRLIHAGDLDGAFQLSGNSGSWRMRRSLLEQWITKQISNGASKPGLGTGKRKGGRGGPPP